MGLLDAHADSLVLEVLVYTLTMRRSQNL